MRTTVGDLIKDAIASGKNTTASNGRWKCRINKDMNEYIVRHHGTDMIIWDENTHQVFPINPGYGSVSDKQGINSMLSGMMTNETYHTLFVEEVGTQGTKSPPIAYEEPEEPKPKLEKFTPPIAVEDTIV